VPLPWPLYFRKRILFSDRCRGSYSLQPLLARSAVGVTKSKLSEQRIVVYGAGSAGMGIADQSESGRRCTVLFSAELVR
jgi:malate dehydrogenase (oxaloacetate-decarboxylating)